MADINQMMIAQLDRDQPRWFIDWATGQELQRFTETAYSKDPHKATTDLKQAVARRLFHRILNASIGAGLMTETYHA